MIRNGQVKVKKIEKSKVDIQENSKTNLGLIVDVPQSGGCLSNNENTARRFFSEENNENVSKIIRFYPTLLLRFTIILITINCGYKINATEFNKFAKEIAAMYIEKYQWYYMPASVHKILIHGAERGDWTTLRNLVNEDKKYTSIFGYRF